jgi:hypothetical protein
MISVQVAEGSPLEASGCVPVSALAVASSLSEEHPTPMMQMMSSALQRAASCARAALIGRAVRTREG